MPILGGIPLRYVECSASDMRPVCDRCSENSCMKTAPDSFLCGEKGLKGEAPCQVLVTQRVEFAASATKDLGEPHLHKQEAHNKMPPSNLCLSPRRE
ncbi:hypothetical protein MHYP_G00126750 [Metynnis hypsauchen]